MTDQPTRHLTRRVLPAALGLAVLGLVAIAPTPATSAPDRATQAAPTTSTTPAALGDLVITDASTTSFPGGGDQTTVCVDGAQPNTMKAGDQVVVEQPVGDVVITVFDSGTASCTDTPDRSITIPLAQGDRIGVVVGWKTLSTFTYDDSCVPAGTSRVIVANGADLTTVPSLDVYAWSLEDGSRTLLAKGLAPGTNVSTPDVPAGTGYLIQAFKPGEGPNGVPLAQLDVADFDDGDQVELMIAGSDLQDRSLGAFTFAQGQGTCPAEEPPPTESESTTTTSASSTTSTSTTTTAPAATPADAVRGTVTFTG